MKPAATSSSTIRPIRKKVEVAKAGKSRNSTRHRMNSSIDSEWLRMAMRRLFVVCLVEFLLFPAFATSTFFLISLMVLLDLAAGFIVTLVAARREAGFRDG